MATSRYISTGWIFVWLKRVQEHSSSVNMYVRHPHRGHRLEHGGGRLGGTVPWHAVDHACALYSCNSQVIWGLAVTYHI